MKYEKERKFVKVANEKCRQEVIVSRIEILKTFYDERNLVGVRYQDRFGRVYEVKRNKNEYIRSEILC